MHPDSIELVAYSVVYFDGQQMHIEGPTDQAAAIARQGELGVTAAVFPISIPVSPSAIKEHLGRIYEERSCEFKNYYKNLIRESN